MDEKFIEYPILDGKISHLGILSFTCAKFTGIKQGQVDIIPQTEEIRLSIDSVFYTITQNINPMLNSKFPNIKMILLQIEDCVIGFTPNTAKQNSVGNMVLFAIVNFKKVLIEGC